MAGYTAKHAEPLDALMSRAQRTVETYLAGTSTDRGEELREGQTILDEPARERE